MVRGNWEMKEFRRAMPLVQWLTPIFVQSDSGVSGSKCDQLLAVDLEGSDTYLRDNVVVEGDNEAVIPVAEIPEPQECMRRDATLLVAVTNDAHKGQQREGFSVKVADSSQSHSSSEKPMNTTRRPKSMKQTQTKRTGEDELDEARRIVRQRLLEMYYPNEAKRAKRAPRESGDAVVMAYDQRSKSSF
jgi:hypothetical protein